MISVIPTHNKNFRAFGWVQDPSNLRSLCDVVAVFDSNSQKHKDLIRIIIPKIVEKRDGRDNLIKALQSTPLKIKYAELVGTSFTPRSMSRCNGIIQATVKGQGRDFIGDWPADNYVRWAHCFGFIKYNYDSKQNRLFEMKTLDLLTEECNYQGLHLGGSRKPDGIIYTSENKCKYGIIIDTKAYSKGYNLPISQADEMERYIGENQTRNEKVNSNKWWNNFGADINEFYFMFVSGHFVGNFKAQIERISRNKSINGVALAVTNLILLAEAYKAGRFTHETIKNEMFNNSEFIL